MQESVGQEIIKRCKSNGVNFFENNEIKRIRSEGYIEEKQYKKIIIATGPWVSTFLKQNKIHTNKTIDYIKGSHLVINRKMKNGFMFRDQKKQRYILLFHTKEIYFLEQLNKELVHLKIKRY